MSEENQDKKTMNWFRQHADTIVILGTFASCFLWLNEKMNDQFNQLNKDMAVIKTVLIMKNIMPTEVAKCEKEKS